MTNKTRTYNNGKAVTRDELDNFIQDAKNNGNWSKVEQSNVSEIVDMSRLFSKVNSIENLNLDGWNTSNVTNMKSMFFSSDYNHPLHFNTSKVKNMAYMFYKSDYNHPLRFDTSNVEYTEGMFYKSKYNHPLDFDTSNVKDMHLMFAYSKYNHPLHFSVDRACPERARIDYDTSKVTDMGFMFYKSSYNHPLHFDISNVINMKNMFDDASIACPITFKGGDIPYYIRAFIDETNIAYDEKRKLEGVIHNECGNNRNNNSAISSSFKL